MIIKDIELKFDMILITVTRLRLLNHYPAITYLFKVNSRNTRETCDICSNLTIKIRDRRQSL